MKERSGTTKTSFADPGLGAFLIPGSGIRDEQPGSYFLELRNHFFGFFGVKILKFFDEDPGWRQFGSRMEKSRIRDRDKHPGSATLVANKKGVLDNRSKRLRPH